MSDRTDGPCQPLPPVTEVATGNGSTRIRQLGCNARGAGPPEGKAFGPRTNRTSPEGHAFGPRTDRPSEGRAILQIN
jgi:hypothetical protein